MKIIFATGNENKLTEIRKILSDLDVEVVSMKEAGIRADIVEDGKTFAENALIKARTICKACGEITMSDDSGLVIDALGGEPGIYSARYMGEDTSYHIKNNNLIERLRGSGESRMKRGPPVLCATSPASSRMEGRSSARVHLRGGSAMRKRDRMASDMIRSSTCRRKAVRLRSCLLQRKMR